jgi:hypothetical protein
VALVFNASELQCSMRDFLSLLCNQNLELFAGRYNTRSWVDLER